MLLNKSLPLVSVVIPTFNSIANVVSCLRAVCAQTYTNIEIVVVDNCSKDNTAKIAEQFGALVLRTPSTLAQARNIGLKLARGMFVLHLDVDMILSPTVVEECVNKAAESYCAISIPEISVGKGYWGKVLYIEKLLLHGDDSIITPRFFSRDLLLSIGGTDEKLDAGEDWDLWMRIKGSGIRTAFIKAPQYHHEFVSISQYIMKKRKWIKSSGRYVSKHGIQALAQWLPIRTYVRNAYRVTIRDLPFMVGVFVLKIVKAFLLLPTIF